MYFVHAYCLINTWWTIRNNLFKMCRLLPTCSNKAIYTYFSTMICLPFWSRFFIRFFNYIFSKVRWDVVVDCVRSHVNFNSNCLFQNPRISYSIDINQITAAAEQGSWFSRSFPSFSLSNLKIFREFTLESPYNLYV